MNDDFLNEIIKERAKEFIFTFDEDMRSILKQKRSSESRKAKRFEEINKSRMINDYPSSFFTKINDISLIRNLLSSSDPKIVLNSLTSLRVFLSNKHSNNFEISSLEILPLLLY